MESNEQLVFEMLRWFDKYVKNAPPRGAKVPQAVGTARQPQGAVHGTR